MEIKALDLAYMRPEVKFRTLLNSWREEVMFTSSTTEIINNINYQKIIGMGRVALPFLLEELHIKPEHLFWALYVITCENPVKDSAVGSLYLMTEAWLIWGRRKGIIQKR